MPTNNKEPNLPYFWVRQLDAAADLRMHQKNNKGRRVVALSLQPEYSLPLKSCRWQPPSKDIEDGKSWIFESGDKRFEISTFNQLTKQDHHYHKEATEIYTVLDGQMSIWVEDEIIALDQGDEIVILPGTWHKVLGGGKFLARVHAINSHGDSDKYTEERLLKLAEEYRDKGYKILIHPNPEDLPDFLRNYRPDMIARREDEAVVIEVMSRSSLNSSSTQYLPNLAQVIEKHPGWRFELVMANPEDVTYSVKAEGSLQENEIKSGLKVASQLLGQHPESAILYSWSLVEATLRLVAEEEGLSLRRFDPLYLVKQLAIEGVISQSEYQLLMDSFSLRNAVAHGFKTTPITQGSVEKLIKITEQLLETLNI